MQFHVVRLPTYLAGIDPAPGTYYQQVLEEVQLAEELGFTGFWFTEHHLVPYGGMIPNPAALITAAAARTSTIRLGCSVSVLPLRHPIHIAEDYALADAVSQGRLNFGVGIGNNPREYGTFGVAMEDGRARFDEEMEIILKAWSGEPFSHRGRFWQLDDVTVYPRPVQRPHPPIWVAGISGASLGKAGTAGYNIMTVAHPVAPEAIRPGTTAWREGLLAAGHDLAQRHCMIHMRGYVGEEPAAARQTAEAALDSYNRLSREGLGRPARPDESNWEGMLATGRNIYGDPTQCIEIMRRTMTNYDFDIFGMQFSFGGIPHDDCMRSMRLFAREVMPAFS